MSSQTTEPPRRRPVARARQSSRFQFWDKTVSRDFREAIAMALPGLANNRAYWRMAQHLFFGTLINEDGTLMIPRELAAECEGVAADANYAAGRFYDRFRADVFDFVIGDYVFSDDPKVARVRSVKYLPLGKAVKALVETERRTLAADRVWMPSGRAWLPRDTAADRAARREEAGQRRKGFYMTPANEALLNYINALPGNRFTSCLRHIPEAMLVAEKLSDATNQKNQLKAIQDHAQPFYCPVEKTTRIFAMGANINNLHRDVRAVLTQDWITADLRQAQLAIVTRVWGMPDLSEYLKTGRSLWPELCDRIGLEYTPSNKAIVKDALYSVVYGAGDKRMVADLAKALAGTHLTGAGSYRRFITHPVIASLLKARTKQLKIIRDEKGGVDAFGNRIHLELREVEGKPHHYDNTRSILASIAQSYELLLLMPIIHSAIAQQFHKHGFTVTAWIHDGFCFDLHDKADLKKWTAELERLVKEQADSLGIHTSLELSEGRGNPL